MQRLGNMHKIGKGMGLSCLAVPLRLTTRFPFSSRPSPRRQEQTAGVCTHEQRAKGRFRCQWIDAGLRGRQPPQVTNAKR